MTKLSSELFEQLGLKPSEIDEKLINMLPEFAKLILLPNAEVVSKSDGPIFPTIRDSANRLNVDEEQQILLDDNTTPRWAILWTHGYLSTSHPKSWTVAHVWPYPKDRYCYTHLANLALLPEYMSSLTDKQGPLTSFLKFHSWEKYKWKPELEVEPQKPEGYDLIKWRYLPNVLDPISLVNSQVSRLTNQRCRKLKYLMTAAGRAGNLREP
jgi:hypothetical protein